MKFKDYLAGLDPIPSVRIDGRTVPHPVMQRERLATIRDVERFEGAAGAQLNPKKADWPDVLERLSRMQRRDWRRARSEGVAVLIPPKPKKKTL